MQAASIVSLLAICVCVQGCRTRESDLVLINKKLEAIPKRATSTQVLKYLDEAGIEHSPYVTESTGQRSIRAILRKRTRWVDVIHTDYSISFRFDDRNSLVDYEVKPIYTGP